MKASKKKKQKKELNIRLGGIFSVVALVVIGIICAKAYGGDKTEISSWTVKNALEPIGEFATYEYNYTSLDVIKDRKHVFGFGVPFTAHRIYVTADGVIKAGYKMEDVDVEVKNKQIIVTLPEPQILDAYIDTYQTDNHNNILNPISPKEVEEALAVRKQTELDNAIAGGLYESAEENAKLLMGELLAQFDGYEVVFR